MSGLVVVEWKSIGLLPSSFLPLAMTARGTISNRATKLVPFFAPDVAGRAEMCAGSRFVERCCLGGLLAQRIFLEVFFRLARGDFEVIVPVGILAAEDGP